MSSHSSKKKHPNFRRLGDFERGKGALQRLLLLAWGGLYAPHPVPRKTCANGGKAKGGSGQR